MTVNATSIPPAELDLIETGGTIDMAGLDSRRPAGNVKGIIGAVKHFAPSVRVHRPLDPPLDSSNIGPRELKKILAQVVMLCESRIVCSEDGCQQAGQPKAVPGIVITHGTDTMQETALLLALELAGLALTFPVILTCAYAPPTEPRSDALRNLVLAATAALSFRLSTNGSHVIPPGVYVVVGNDLHLASRIKKVTTRPAHNRSYVESYPAPAGQLTIAHKANLWQLDVENEVRFRIHRDLFSPRHNGLARRLAADNDLGYVEHIWFKKDSPVEILDRALARCHYQAVQSGRSPALVLQGDFSNRPKEELYNLSEVIRRFRRGEVQVPIFSGSPSVVTKVNAYSKRQKLIFLIPKSLSHSKARTKLAWLLRSKVSPAELCRKLCQDIAGECFEVPMLPDWIAGESYGPNNHLDTQIAKRVVIVFPGIDSSVYAEAVESLVKTGTKKKELNIVAFGDGNIPLSPTTVAETVSSYITQRYGVDFNLAASAIYLDVEAELAAILRYNTHFRNTIAAKYVIANRREMVRKLFSWCIREGEKAEQLRVERKAGILAGLLAEEFGLNETRVRNIIEDDNSWGRTFLLALRERQAERNTLLRLPEILKAHGLSIHGVPSQFPDEVTEPGGYLVPHIEEWLKTVEGDPQQMLLLAKISTGVYARRIMKDAIAAYHPVINEIVRAVDSGIQVYVKSNAEMARTDTRRYELGNFLLIAGAQSAEAPGWEAGPLRLRAPSST